MNASQYLPDTAPWLMAWHRFPVMTVVDMTVILPLLLTIHRLCVRRGTTRCAAVILLFPPLCALYANPLTVAQEARFGPALPA